MKLKCPSLLKPLDTIIQENCQPFYPSEPFRILRFQIRHPVDTIRYVFGTKVKLTNKKRIKHKIYTVSLESTVLQSLQILQGLSTNLLALIATMHMSPFYSFHRTGMSCLVQYSSQQLPGLLQSHCYFTILNRKGIARSLGNVSIFQYIY